MHTFFMVGEMFSMVVQCGTRDLVLLLLPFFGDCV